MQRQIIKGLDEYLELEKQGLIARDTQRKLANKYKIPYVSIKAFICRYLQDNTIKDKYKKSVDNAYNKPLLYWSYKEYLNIHKLNAPQQNPCSTFSTILYDLTPKHKLDFTIIEMCLAHSVGNMVIQSYNHSERNANREDN